MKSNRKKASYLVIRVHFLELVDAADAIIGQHEGSSLDTEFSRFSITDN